MGVVKLQKREAFPDLAPILWHSCGTIAALLQVSSIFLVSPFTSDVSKLEGQCTSWKGLQGFCTTLGLGFHVSEELPSCMC